MKTFGLTAALSVAALLILLALPAGGVPRSSLAQEATSLSIDVIPEGNTATTLGPIDPCASAKKGQSFNVDLVIQDTTDLLAWEISISYDPEVLVVRDRDAEQFQAANEGSRILDLSEETPDDDGRYLLQSVDTADPASGDSGSGVLARLIFKAKSSGVSQITIDKVDLNDDGKLDRAPFLRNVDAEPIGDEDGDTFFDGPTASAEIQVGQPCPGQADAMVQVVDDVDGGGTNVALVVAAVLGGLAIAALAVALAVFLLRRRRASPS